MQNLGQEILKRQRNETISVIIEFLEHICHPFQADAALHEQIEAEMACALLVIAPKEKLHKLRTQSVAKCLQGVCVLVEADVATPIGIEAVEECAPRSEETPQPAKLVKVHGS